MNKTLVAIATVLASTSAVVWAKTDTLTSLPAIHALTNAEAGHHIPVDFEATVTYYRDYERTLFVQDGDTAIYVQPDTGLKLMPGDRVRVRGTTDASFRPIIRPANIVRLGHVSMPRPVPASYDDMIAARYDCRLVTVRAVVRSADVANYALRNSRMQVLVDGADVDVTLDANDSQALNRMLDAEVEITGAESGRFDGKMQLTGAVLHVASLENISVLKQAQLSPWSLPLTAMDEILTGYHVINRTGRVRVQGTITYYQPGSAVVLQNGAKSLWIMIKGHNDLRLGDVADATGIPAVRDGFLTLDHGEVRDSGIQLPVIPRESSWSELTASRRLFDLVSTRGTVVMAAREAAQDEYVLLSGGHLFNAILRHPVGTYGATADPALPPMKEIPVGATVQVRGICVLEDSNPFDATVPYDLMMRSYDDIAVIARPSWMNVQNLARVISAMVVIILGVTAWGWMLRRKVHRQTEVLAARAQAEAETERRNARLQRQRSRILEDINGARPLAEILEEVTEFISMHLNGAACWCEIADGARLGRYGANTTGMRVVSEPILSRSGPPLGTVFAAIDPAADPDPNQKDAFFAGSQLAALAIENRRLYSDLVHRSEFDLLTDIHNRFSLDKQMDLAIARARDNAGIFGLIYIDLDDFKRVNDKYGHRIGDLYLQEVTRRMKRQLRAADLLARLGGDEFAVLVPAVHRRAEVEEIAARLAHCFRAPFRIDGHVMEETASFGLALYPEDGSTKDSLLSSADAAMYVGKHVREGEERPEPGNAAMVRERDS
jgi:diguanylate cyclase (GGDEF)-like protein